MDDSIEADLLAASLAPFAHGEAAWIDRYVSARARLDPALEPERVVAAGRLAWDTHGWAHPAAVAHLEHELGPLGAG
jgi:hypothetical protein